MLKLLYLTALALLLSACQRTEQTPPPLAPTPVPAPTSAPAPSEILRSFESDIKACSELIRALEPDRAFVEGFQSAKTRSSQPIEALLQKTTAAQSPAVAYFLGHQKYMTLGVDFHNNPWAVDWVKDEPVFCAPTSERLSEIESLGESSEAWKVRVFFLDRALNHLSPPADEGPGGDVGFDLFQKFLSEAAKLYVGAQQATFNAWVEKAILIMDEERKRFEEGTAGLTLAQQNEIQDERISVLRKLVRQAP